MVRFALNGCGRIGRLVLRGIAEDTSQAPGAVPVALNDRFDAPSLAASLGRDTLHGPFPAEVRAEGPDRLRVGEHLLEVLQVPRPQDCPWERLEVDLVVEATGHFLGRGQAAGHLEAGASRVLVTAPLDGPPEAVEFMLVPGVNDAEVSDGHRVVSLSSCTTNCAAQILEVLRKRWGVGAVHLSTVHAYTRDQRLLDGAHPDPRRARAAALNIIPTTTRADEALQRLFPELRGSVAAVSYRVPVPGASLVDLVVRLEEAPASAEAVNEALRERAEELGPRLLRTTEEPVVSWDLLGCPASAVVDEPLTTVLAGNQVKVVAWYDNEAGYAARVVDFLAKNGVRHQSSS